MNITVAGLGYVGLSNAILLAQNNKVTALDINENRVSMVNARKSPLNDPEMIDYFANKTLDLHATTDAASAYSDADFVIISTPTNYDPATKFFDTSSVESAIKLALEANSTSSLIIKSTIPVGFVDQCREKFDTKRIMFSPEFLREGRALYDNLYPSRIIVGDTSTEAQSFANLLKEGAIKSDVQMLFTGTSEAEAIKLFSNTYLAMRVSYFNELDSYAITNGLNAAEIIKGASLDPRIGEHYNNPSFGYGGYCLPKDTKQLLANFEGTKQDLIGAIVRANDTRKDMLAGQILARNPSKVGIYRLAMKAGADNYRDSAVFGIIERLQAKGVDVAIYEPTLDVGQFMNCDVVEDLSVLKSEYDVIVANRLDDAIKDVKVKVFSRDVFGVD